MTTQTKAERLADDLVIDYFGDALAYEAAVELRRLVSLNKDLMDEVARLNKEALHEQAAESLDEGLRLDDWDKIGCVNHDCDKCKAQQEPVAFYIYKPTLPHGNLGQVADGDLPWVYDQAPSSGFVARMLVTPYTPQPPAQPLTDEQIKAIHHGLCGTVGSDYKTISRAIEAAHGIAKGETK